MTLPALLLAFLAPQAAPPDTVPLFASLEPLELTVVADLEAMRKDKAEEPEDRPAVVILADGDTLEAELRPRGHFRRDPRNCTFPPLRLDVKTGSAEGTVFQGQDKLKMVVPCRPEREDQEQFVLLEYAIYRAYLLFTEEAFRVRLARVTFVDTGGGRKEPFTRAAFFIEDDDALAARVGAEVLEVPEGSGVLGSYFEPRSTTRVALFQYMVGNTDWSAEGMHNVKVVQGEGTFRPVPYDFDFSGLVNTPYAVPNPMLGTTSVRERVFRGWCFDDATREEYRQAFLTRRAEIEAVFAAVPGLEEKRAQGAVSYLKGFFDAIETPERAQRRVFRDCRKM